MCRNAPRTFRLDRSAFASSQVATRFTATPMPATTITGTPSTDGGVIRRRSASTSTTPLTTTSVMPLPAAERISARFQP